MRKRINNKAYLFSILAIVCVGAALLLCSEQLALHTRDMRSNQSKLLRVPSITTEWQANSLSEEIAFLVQANFFRKKVIEPFSVVEIRKVTNLPPDRYFPDIWSVFKFLIFMEQRVDLHRALGEALRRRFLRDEAPCAGSNCNPDEKYDVNEANATRVIDLLAETYLDRSLDAFQAVAVAEGRQAVDDLQSLTVPVIFGPAAYTTSAYNRILVIGAFLGRYDFQTYRQFRKQDYDMLEKVIAEKEVEGRPSDSAIAAYVDGLNKLRGNCFIKASELYESQIGKNKHGPINELVSFMAMRSLARPFVDLSQLGLAKNGKDIFVKDCAGEIDGAAVMAKFFSLEKKYRGQIKRRGLLSDIEYYREQLPSSAERLAEIREAVTKLEQGDSKPSLASSPPDEPSFAAAAANAAENPVKASDDGDSSPRFRWPVRGKVVTAFGAKTNGKSNDGINIAVPEGTPVKAADDGVVAYSGSELKGYGSFILVRHSNGYITAYAHASELLVKRDDTVKRGQIIAKSGQSGEVGSPQLHFEIRKGSSPVDPMRFLTGG